MSDFRLIRLLPFSEKEDEWPIWIEKFLSKAKSSGFKDVLLGKVNIPKYDEEINQKTEEGKVLMQNADLHEMVYKELILSIDVRISSGEVVFGIIKGCKRREYIDRKSALAWHNLTKKFDPFLTIH
jgi:hypothetical protein